jgi:hypothetical protein
MSTSDILLIIGCMFCLFLIVRSAVKKCYKYKTKDEPRKGVNCVNCGANYSSQAFVEEMKECGLCNKSDQLTCLFYDENDHKSC